MRFACILLSLALFFTAAGCMAVPPATTSPTDTAPPPTTTPTPTTIWFPPTPTLTLMPTAAGERPPTPGPSPVAGELLLADDFNDPTAWSTGRTGSGGIALGNNELTLAINRPNGYLSSLRRGTRLGDFFLEITANPTICRSGDEYGLLLRASSSLDFYRFSLTCDGQARVDKLLQGKASSPQGLTPSGAVPRGAPSQSRLAVQARGKDLHFYVNGEYQFSIRDPSLTAGGIGVFARAAGDGAVTVNFSDLKIYQPTP